MGENTKAVAVNPTQEIQERMGNWIAEMATTKQINFPVNYSPENALKSAMFILADTKDKDKKPVLEVCTKGSIYLALQKMLTNGFNPSKKQCYFIAYGNKLEMTESYFGVYKVAKSCSDIKHVNPQVVYQDDEFEFETDIETGVRKITKHKSKLENIDDNKIKAAYCIVIYKDGTQKADIMTISQIKKAWGKSTYGINPKTHGDFAEEMCKRTILKRAVKLDVNSSDDSNLFIEDEEAPEEIIRQDIKEKSTGIIIDVATEELSAGQIEEKASSTPSEEPEPEKGF